MKIELTKDEWEFVHRMCCYFSSPTEDLTDHRSGVTLSMYKNGQAARKFMQKLGEEWKNE